MKDCNSCRYRPCTSISEYCLQILSKQQIKDALSGKECSLFKWPLDSDGNEVKGSEAYLYYERLD
jgi:hypothetical protein